MSPLRTAPRAAILALGSALTGCAATEADPTPTPRPEPVFFPQPVGPLQRPALLEGPQAWLQDEALPLVVLLHGYSANAAAQDLLLGWSDLIEDERFLLLLPEGTRDGDGNQFWNATESCCDFEGSGVDDSAYLRDLIDETMTRWNVDPGLVFITGHSNGGFMSYRMACDHGDVVAAIAPLAGAMWRDAGACPAGPAVSVLHQHGDSDSSVLFDGDPDGAPGALASVQPWGQRAGCDLNQFALEELDLIPSADGAETLAQTWNVDCRPGEGIALWRHRGVGHVPLFGDDYARLTLDWLRAHGR